MEEDKGRDRIGGNQINIAAIGDQITIKSEKESY